MGPRGGRRQELVLSVYPSALTSIHHEMIWVWSGPGTAPELLLRSSLNSVVSLSPWP